MGIVQRIKQLFSSKRSVDLFNNSFFNFGTYVNDDNILSSSDTYYLLKLISDQVALANFIVEDETGKDIYTGQAAKVLKQLNNPNDYLTSYEFKKLLVNVYLLRGEVFLFHEGSQLHILDNVYAEMTNYGYEKYSLGGQGIPRYMIRHIKNIGVNHLKGVGLLDLARETLEGVMNAEKALTDKYKKGGLMAFLLKLEAHLSPTNANQNKTVKKILDQLEDIKDSGKTKLIPLGKGYEIEALESPVDDEKTLQYLSIYKKDLGKYFGLDKELLDKLEEKDMEQAMMKLFTSCLKPIFKNIEEHLTALLLGEDSGLKIKFRHDLLDFVGIKTKTEIAYNLVRTMIATPDDARKMLGWDPLNTEESSKLYVSKDLVGIDRLHEEAANALKGGEDDG
ncbi:phage portal protein [Bacillus safensis]|nr:phage portal protein [Bacillus safensis]MCK1973332.1 phage portal protein [Bacillus safensis]MCY7541616.1 phage portal protein [Bacillus safensis]MCY7551216.1 phage portal protein [Bacillus safensis]MCY7645538.1 phage portal protein [Bacillus safensis]MCY7654989.1 phage portal protein [Bacillus safensis]